MAEQKWKKAIRARPGLRSPCSAPGQWTIWEGYAAAKLLEGRLPHQQPRPQRAPLHGVGGGRFSCAPSASTSRWAATTTSSTPTPSCCGARTWPEMHPSCGAASPTGACRTGCQVHVLSTFEHRSFELADSRDDLHAADRPGDPQLHLQHIIQNGKVNRPSSEERQLQEGRDRHRLRPAPEPCAGRDARSNGYPGADGKPRATPARRPITFDEFAKFVAEYTAEKVSKLSGVPEDRLVKMAEQYADPNRKVVSFWTMGFNQHTRGTWVNNMIYNVHLLVGKIRSPATARSRSPASPRPAAPRARSAPSAHRLPADMVVTNPSTARSPRNLEAARGHDPAQDRSARWRRAAR